MASRERLIPLGGEREAARRSSPGKGALVWDGPNSLRQKTQLVSCSELKSLIPDTLSKRGTAYKVFPMGSFVLNVSDICGPLNVGMSNI